MYSTRPHHHSALVGRFCFHQDASVNNLALQYLLKQVSDTALDLLSLLLLPMLIKKKLAFLPQISNNFEVGFSVRIKLKGDF